MTNLSLEDFNQIFLSLFQIRDDLKKISEINSDIYLQSEYPKSYYDNLRDMRAESRALEQSAMVHICDLVKFISDLKNQDNNHDKP